MPLETLFKFYKDPFVFIYKTIYILVFKKKPTSQNIDLSNI